MPIMTFSDLREKELDGKTKRGAPRARKQLASLAALSLQRGFEPQPRKPRQKTSTATKPRGFKRRDVFNDVRQATLARHRV